MQTYVLRLAELYGVGYPTFCKYALGTTDLDQFKQPHHEVASDVYERLSSGTGVSVRTLWELHTVGQGARFERRMAELESTPEGRAVIQQLADQFDARTRKVTAP